MRKSLVVDLQKKVTESCEQNNKIDVAAVFVDSVNGDRRGSKKNLSMTF